MTVTEEKILSPQWELTLFRFLLFLPTEIGIGIQVMLTMKYYILPAAIFSTGLVGLAFIGYHVAVATAAVVATACLVIRLVWLEIFRPNIPPQIYGCDEELIATVLNGCLSLRKVYRPPVLWGRISFVQMSLMGMLGRYFLRRPHWKRYYCSAEDGAEVTYDEIPPAKHDKSDALTIILAPGIGNFSDTHYIRYSAFKIQEAGYRCVVLNHLGIPPGVEVKTPRIFSYGMTFDLAAVVSDVGRRYPKAPLLLAGYSMGANIVTKYVGEQRVRPTTIIGAVSYCQGYEMRGEKTSNEIFGGFRRIYLALIAEVMKHYIFKNREVLLSDEVKKKYDLDERLIRKAATVVELDEVYSRRIYGYETLDDFYKDSSSLNFMTGTTVPLILINAEDDPICPLTAAKPARLTVDQNKKMMLIMTKYGSHIGFYSGGFLIPDNPCWADKVLLELARVLNNLPPNVI